MSEISVIICTHNPRPDYLSRTLRSPLWERQQTRLLGIGEASFEEKFMPYLLDEKGSLLPSVKFHRIPGAEKHEILASAEPLRTSNPEL
jgi:hypothetical protein